MPELPEVEVVRLFLSNHLISKTIKDLEVYNPKSFLGNSKDIINQKIISFSRIGKQLSIHLQNNLIILVHLKMTGQLIYLPVKNEPTAILGHPTPKEAKEWPNKSTRLQFIFSDNSRLFFNDQRKFGWVKVFTKNELTEFQSNLGIDILDSAFTFEYFFNELQKSSRPIKSVLLDQNKFAGIGNIYANDALFISKINPTEPSGKISRIKAHKLWLSLIDLIKESIGHGGSTAKDNKYIHPDGSVGTHQYHFRVYQKTGEPCPVCRTPIKRMVIGGRGTFYCPFCQKVLK